MGGCSSAYEVWLPGYEPDHCHKPYIDEKEGGIQEAYRKAAKFVKENPNDGYCTVGPGTWLKCWKSENEPKFKKVKDNVVLHLNCQYLKVEEHSKNKMENDCKTVEGHLKC